MCEFYKGTVLSKSDLSIEGRPCILYGQLYTTYKNEIIKSVVSKTQCIDKNIFIGKSNDVIIPASGETPEDISTACCVLVDDVLFGGDLNVLRTNHNGSFLSYQLNGRRKFDIAKLAVGKSVVHLHNDQLKKLDCYFPQTIEEENKIVALMDTLDVKINTQNKIIEDLVALKNELKEELSRQGTAHVKIGDLLTEVSIKSTIQNQYPVLSSTVKGLFLQSEYFDRQVASENNIGYKVVERGDIIISPQNLWMGNMTLNDKFENGLVSPSYKIYRINADYEADLVFHKLTTRRSFYNYSLVSEQGASIVRRNLNIDAFEQLVIPFDSVKDTKILNSIRRISSKLENETAALKCYMLQKEYLLENLFI